MEKMFLIPAGLLQATIQYMATKPYSEVGTAIPALMALKEVPPPAEEYRTSVSDRDLEITAPLSAAS